MVIQTFYNVRDRLLSYARETNKYIDWKQPRSFKEQRRLLALGYTPVVLEVARREVVKDYFYSATGPYSYSGTDEHGNKVYTHNLEYGSSMRPEGYVEKKVNLPPTYELGYYRILASKEEYEALRREEAQLSEKELLASFLAEDSSRKAAQLRRGKRGSSLRYFLSEKAVSLLLVFYGAFSILDGLFLQLETRMRLYIGIAILSIGLFFSIFASVSRMQHEKGPAFLKICKSKDATKDLPGCALSKIIHYGATSWINYVLLFFAAMVMLTGGGLMAGPGEHFDSLSAMIVGAHLFALALLKFALTSWKTFANNRVFGLEGKTPLASPSPRCHAVFLKNEGIKYGDFYEEFEEFAIKFYDDSKKPPTNLPPYEEDPHGNF